MKIKGIITTLALSMTLGLGAALTYNHNSNEVKSANAAIAPGNTFAGDYYIYYIPGEGGETNNRIHAWNGDGDFDNWPGAMIKDNSLKYDVLRYKNSDFKVYKISFSSPLTGFMFTYSEDGYNAKSQTENKTFNNGYAYTWGSETGDAADGKALDLLFAVEAKRNAVRQADGAIADYSICGISVSDCQSLYDQYAALTAIEKGYVDSSMTYTYTDKTASAQDNIFFSAIMNQIGKRGGRIANAASTMPVIANNSSTAIIIVISSVSVLSLGGLFFLKKKKEN